MGIYLPGRGCVRAVSAGKRTRRRITPGNRWLKKTLAQAAWAASHTKNTYLASQYRRVAGHRGRKRALIAVGHSMLVYHMMRTGSSYADLGGDFFDRLEPERLTRLLRQALGTPRSQSHAPSRRHRLSKIFGAAAKPLVGVNLAIPCGVRDSAQDAQIN
ncbi:MAG: hypothetical protein DMG30_16950 [Acidobacteria bacterium]|nr:MAG: hypothetical protein DMG30_16950 [Acidobacteriota bacterium]